MEGYPLALGGFALGLLLVAALVVALRRRAVLELEKARLEESVRYEADRATLLEQTEKRMRDAFEALSSEALRRSNESFLDLARTSFETLHRGAAGELEQRRQSIDALVKPLREALDRVDSQIQAAERDRAGTYSRIAEQMRAVAVQQEALQTETARLVTALRRPEVRGRWGEVQLRRVVELAGMLQHCDFVPQVSIPGPEGRLRPDLIVQLPGRKQIVVDAKAPLEAYLDAVEARDEAERQRHLEQHARQVREHVRKLGQKSYAAGLPGAPEFVVLFLPGEAFFSAAAERDPELIEFGAMQQVIVASPTTLIALLRAAAYGWQQEALAENAQRISEAGRDLHDRVGVLLGHLDKLGRGLAQSVQSYNGTLASLESRLLPAARRLRDLGAGARDLPEPERIDVAPRELPSPSTDSSDPAP